MSLISGIDSNSLLNTLFNSLNNSANSKSSPNTETSVTDTQQTTSDSAAESINSLLDQMKISLMHNQYSFMTSLFSPDDSTPSDSLTSVLENASTDKKNNVSASNPQLAQLFNALNLSSSSAASNDPTESLLQSLDGSSLSRNNSDSMQTAMEDLLNSSGNTINSSAQGILDQYHSLLPDKSSLIKTIV
jgi:acetyl/propionyl-CoA carboxylase alpha subunit